MTSPSDLARPPVVSLASRPEDVRDVWLWLKLAKQRLRAVDAEIQAQVLEWINEHGDLDLETGRRLYAGVRREWRPTASDAEILDAALTYSDGDLEAVADLLAAKAWKPGALQEALGEAFDALFERVEVGTVKDGVSRRQVLETRDNGETWR